MGGSEGDDKGEDAEAPQGEGGAGKAAIPPPPMPPPAMLPPAPRAQASAGTQQKDEDAKTESKEVGEGEQNWATTALPAEGAGGGEPGAYEKPPWSGAPPTESFPYYFEVLKNGTIVDKIMCEGREFVLIGRNADTCGLVLEFKGDGTAYIYDMSTHGTRVNKRQLKQRVYARLRVGDVLALGQTSRLVIFNGPEELAEAVEGGWQHKEKAPAPPPQTSRAVAQMAPKGSGGEKVTLGTRDVSWGFGEDAQEVDSGDEVGDAVGEARELKEAGKLSEKIEKQLDRCEKHMSRIANLKDEMKKIRAKEDAGVELTQGQQAQVEKNDAKVKEIEVLLLEADEALAEMLRPGGNARGEGGGAGKGRGKQAGAGASDDDSDDTDSFYNRAKAHVPKSKEPPRTLETLRADLERMEEEDKELRGKLQALMQASSGGDAGGDAVDAYLSKMEQTNAKKALLAANKRLKEIEVERPKVMQLIALVSPALPELGRRPAGAVVNQRALAGLLAGAKQASRQPVMREVVTEGATAPPPAAEVHQGLAAGGAAEGVGAGRPAAGEGGEEGGGAEEEAASAGGNAGGDAAAGQAQGAGEVVSPRMPPGGARAASPAGDAGRGAGGIAASSRSVRSESGVEGAVTVAAAAAPPAVPVLPVQAPSSGAGGGPGGEGGGGGGLGDGGPRGVKRGAPRPDGWGGTLPPVPDFVDEARGGLHRPSPAKKAKAEPKGPPAPPAGAGGGEEEEEAWRPPSGQTGDGTTSLNDKLGY